MSTSIVKTTDCGQGLVAAADLPPGTLVARFDGPIVSLAQVPASEFCHAILLEEDRWLIPETPARYMNHSCEPNCKVLDSLDVVTIRPVREGDELTFCYNKIHPEERANYWKNPGHYQWDERWSFDCRCGSTRCVGRVAGYVFEEFEESKPALEIRHFPGKGRGVVARRRILADETIEAVPVLFVPAQEWEHLEKTSVAAYTFCWGPDHEHAAVALGLGSMYNHSYQPNARYLRHLDAQMLDFVALRTIEAGEEITVNYNGEPDDSSPLWFEVR